MNRILFEKAEIADGIATFGGERAEHVMNVLHGEVGQILKTGEVDGLIGTSEIVEILTMESNVGNCGGRDSSAPIRIRARVDHTEKSIEPWIDVILAPPRPRVMKRLLPQLAAMGVGRLVLVGAEKVERDFWGATLLKPENYRPLFVDGLMQAGTSILPELLVRKSFRRFVRDELDALFPQRRRLVAHPYDAPADVCAPSAGETERLLLAIGPEGGWTDGEVALLEERGFRRYSLGGRILRTDTATIALLAKLG